MKYLAIDIGASSGRHILGWKENGTLVTKEIYRFPNMLHNADGALTWDLDALLREVKTGIRVAFDGFENICSLSVDTWGVDYVLLNGDREILPCYSYRDSRTEAFIEEVHSRIPFEELYGRTGCQFQPFNSIYQIYTDFKQGRLAQATDLLMLPEYIMYKLTGNKAREYTNATTTGLVNARTGEFDADILKRLGLPQRLFPGLSRPGTRVGTLSTEVAQEVGGNCMVTLCPTHDTASAVEGIPMEGNYPYISSGTWSLLGVKTEAAITSPDSRICNFSNEGGPGYNRYQKNIMGMWLVNSLQKEICPFASYSAIIDAARASTFDGMVDADSPDFLAPVSMKAAFDLATAKGCRTMGDYFRCAYRSLAACYSKALKELEKNTERTYDHIYIVGGGAKNQFLNELTAEMSGKQVIDLPIEATALGNLTYQMGVI